MCKFSLCIRRWVTIKMILATCPKSCPPCPQAYLPIMVEQSQGGEKKGYHEVEGKDVIISIITFGRRGKRKKENMMSTSPAHHGPIFLSLSSVPSYTVHLSKSQGLNTPFISPRQFPILHLFHEPLLVTVLHFVQTIHTLV